jgi:uncharacterized RDD family membrane protein YckC
MFIIIGGDSREYGPATVEQVRAWIGAGRANLDTRAKALGTEEWRRLGDFAEFAGPAAPPPVLGETPAGPSGPTFGGPLGAGLAGSLASGPELAGIGARTGAALFNALLYFLSFVPGSMMMARRMLEANPQLMNGGIPRMEDLDLTGVAEGAVWMWAGLFGACLLQSLLIAARGQNLGKLLVGARVVRLDGAPAGFVRGVLLRFALPVSLLFLLNVAFPLGFLFLIVDYCFIFRADRRCLHDLIAGTRVVRG